jgi:hypothetical protein
MPLTVSPAVARAAHVLAQFTPPRSAEEHYYCMNDFCEGAEIPQGCIRDQVDAKTNVRRVVARCPHCRRGYEAWFVMRGGQWQRSGVVLQLDPEPADPLAERLNEPPSLADHINERFAEASAETDDDQPAVPQQPSPQPTNPPDVQQLDTDCDVAAARAEEERPQIPEPERTLDTSTSQIVEAPDPD